MKKDNKQKEEKDNNRGLKIGICIFLLFVFVLFVLSVFGILTPKKAVITFIYVFGGLATLIIVCMFLALFIVPIYLVKHKELFENPKKK